MMTVEEELERAKDQNAILLAEKMMAERRVDMLSAFADLVYEEYVSAVETLVGFIADVGSDDSPIQERVISLLELKAESITLAHDMLEEAMK